MIEETYKPVPFNGEPEKIVIESENGGFCPPAPGQEMMQRLTLRRNGKVFFTRYFSGDYSKVTPTANTKTMNRYNSKLTVKLMAVSLVACGSEPEHTLTYIDYERVEMLDQYDCIAIYAQYVNGSSETAIPADWVDVKAFQNGTEMEILLK